MDRDLDKFVTLFLSIVIQIKGLLSESLFPNNFGVTSILLIINAAITAEAKMLQYMDIRSQVLVTLDVCERIQCVKRLYSSL